MKGNIPKNSRAAPASHDVAASEHGEPQRPAAVLPAGLVRPRVVVAEKNDEPLSRFYQPIHCNDLVLREYEGLGHLHGGVCWTAGHVLALTLHRHYHHVVHKSTVVELGAAKESEIPNFED